MPDAQYRRGEEGQSYILPGGDVHTVMLSGAESNRSLAVLEIRCPPGGGPPPHTEPTNAFFRVIEGEIQFWLERDGTLETVTLRPGDTAFVPGGAGHAFRNVGGSPARMIVVGQPAGLEDFIAEAGVAIQDAADPPPPPEVHDRDHMEAIFARHGVVAFQVGSAVW
jgi:quercetin dioxygenase-like cupin family protein